MSFISSEDDECPSIELALPSVGDALPPPCRGSFYAEALRVSGGDEPYVWSEVSAPPGLYFDADSATVQGVAEGDGVLTVEVTDASSRTVQKSYEVATREACWLAYVASEPAPAHLELIDGRLLERQPEYARRTLPEQPGLPAVIDFQLSPDGRFVAYRLDPGAPRLELARLSNGRARGVALDGAVMAYAWSEDSAVIAVALDVDGEGFLAGVDVSAVDATTADPGSGLDGIRSLAAVAAPRPDSALSWYDSTQLAYFARDAGGPRRLVTLPVRQTSVAAPTLHDDRDFSPVAALLAGAGGVFVAEPVTGTHEFFPTGGSVTAHAADVVIAPSGAFAGLSRDGAIQIYRPDRASAPTVPPLLEANGCAAVLAWAGGRERLACSDSRGSDRIAWFDVTAGGDAIAERAELGDSYVYPSADHAGRRRAFSPSGRWFAFTTRDELYVARIEPGPPELRAVLPSSALGLPASVLAFSPDESWLVVGAANTLGALDLERGASSFRVLGASAVFDEFCSERFVDGPGAWCGSASRAPDVSWSSGSDLIAFRSSLGTLQLIDLSSARDGLIGDALSPDACSEGCSSSGTARFQP